jgi:hypothetical protein
MTKTIQRSILQFTCFFALVIFGAGCGGNVEEPQKVIEDREPAGTITFVEKDAMRGVIRGTYNLEGYETRFEVIRGDATPPEAMNIYPGVTSHSIDVRVCDSQNFCFINGTSGHGLTSSDWIIEDSNREPTSDESAKNFKNIWSLHQEISRAPTGTFDGLEEEIQSLLDATNQPPESTNGIPPEYDPYQLKPKSLNKGTPQNGVLSLTLSTTASYTHILQIWRQKLIWPFAYHSSSSSKVFDSNGQIVSIFYTCNHGACSNGSNTSMTLYCSRNFSDRSTATPPTNVPCDDSAKIGTLHAQDDSIGCCMSQYSYVPLALSHVCNDDTRLQRDIMIADSPIAASFCADRYLQGQAPYCW